MLVLRMRRGRSAADGRTARRRAGTGRAMVAPCRAVRVTVTDDGGVPAVAMAGAMVVSARGARVVVGAVSVAGIRVEAIRLGELLLDGAALLLDLGALPRGLGVSALGRDLLLLGLLGAALRIETGALGLELRLPRLQVALLDGLLLLRGLLAHLRGAPPVGLLLLRLALA